jgi:hypothetical protein
MITQSGNESPDRSIAESEINRSIGNQSIGHCQVTATSARQLAID